MINLAQVLVFLFYLFLSPSPVFAHDKSQPHFFKINGSYLDHYPISSTSLPDFILPQEILVPPLEINKQYVFQIEKNRIPLTNTMTNDASFFLDFGDGQKENGIAVTHAYSHTGTYLVSASVQPLFSEKITTMNIALLNIVADKKYQLPKAVITMNGTPAKAKEIGVAFSHSIEFSASASTPSPHIVNYFWDLGDGQTSDKATVSHTYAPYHTAANVILRIKDDQGFLSDTVIRLVDQEKIPLTATQNSTLAINSRNILVLISIGLCIGVLLVSKRRRRSKKPIDRR